MNLKALWRLDTLVENKFGDCCSAVEIWVDVSGEIYGEAVFKSPDADDESLRFFLMPEQAKRLGVALIAAAATSEALDLATKYRKAWNQAAD